MSVVQTTQAQQAELNTAAQRFDQVNGELQQMLSTLMRELEITRTGWQGAGGRSFEAVKLAWQTDQDALNRNLMETAEGLRTAGRNYDATDTDAAGTLRRVGRTDLTALG
jgi:WXG100 family type VII secretion target